jgi:hypothetical protein
MVAWGGDFLTKAEGRELGFYRRREKNGKIGEKAVLMSDS